MSIIVQTEDPNIKFNFKISFDKYGNLYFDGNNYVKNEYFNINQNLLFQINISEKNIPYAENGLYNILEPFKNKMNIFTLFDKDNSLKAKIKKKKKKK